MKINFHTITGADLSSAPLNQGFSSTLPILLITSIKKEKMKTRNLILVIGILGVIISVYNAVAGESIKSNLPGFLFGIGLILVYFEKNKSK